LGHFERSRCRTPTVAILIVPSKDRLPTRPGQGSQSLKFLCRCFGFVEGLLDHFLIPMRSMGPMSCRLDLLIPPMRSMGPMSCRRKYYRRQHLPPKRGQHSIRLCWRWRCRCFRSHFHLRCFRCHHAEAL
jgi:hypothetical protein